VEGEAQHPALPRCDDTPVGQRREQLRGRADLPVATANFPGWVLMDRIPVHERLLLKSMRTPTGDFRDLDAVTAWGREIAPLLRG
jgi:hypothetical protein